MATRLFQTALTGGEISPRAQGRLDLDKTQIGADRLKNMAVLVQGGATRRPGSYVIHDAASHAARSWLFPFIFSNAQAYVLEFAPLVIRVFQDRRIVTGAGDGTELATNGTFTTDLAGWAVVNAGTGTTVWNAAGVARLNAGASGTTRLDQAITTVAGQEYVLGWTSLWQLGVAVGTTQGGTDLFQAFLGAGIRTIKFVATTTTSWIGFTTSENLNVDVDNVSVQAAEPLVVVSPYTADALPALRFAQSADVLYITHPDYPIHKLLRVTAVEWELRTVALQPPPTRELPQTFAASLTPGATTGAGVTFTASGSVFLASDVNKLLQGGAGRAAIASVTSATQVSADILDAFTSTTAITAGQWSLLGSPRATLTPSAIGPVGAIIALTTDLAAFRSTDLGKYIRVFGGYLRLAQIVSATSAGAVVLAELVDAEDPIVAAEPGAWTLEDPIWSATRGWPGVCAFHEQRLILGGSDLEPLTFVGSRINDYENFLLGALDTDAYDYVVPGPYNMIRGLVSLRRLLIGTGGGWLQGRGSGDSPITPATPPLVVPENDKGMAFDPAPVIANNAVLFLQRGSTRIREMAYSFGDDAYNATDLTVLVDHLTDAGLVQIARQIAPDSYVYAVREDGALLCCAYERPEKVVAWSRWITGERQDLTDGFYESVCVIPNACDTGDEVWVAVRRRIAIVEPAAALSIALGADTVGATITFTTDAAVFTAEDVGRTITDLVTGTGVALITTVTSATEVDATIIEAFDAAVASLAATDWDLSTLRRVIELFDYGMQVDSGVRYAGSAADAVSGLDHLVGATVTTLADGVDGAALVDADGMVTLAAAATEIQAGVGYLSRVRTLRPEANLPGGLSAGRTRRMVDALVRFFCCGPGWTVNDKDVGLTGDEDELIQDKRVVNLGWDRLGRITIEQARPYPGTVLAIGGRMEVEDDG